VGVENIKDFGGAVDWTGDDESIGAGSVLVRSPPKRERRDSLRHHGKSIGPLPIVSSLKRAEYSRAFFEQTALSDLLGVSADKVNEDRLYRVLDKVLPHKGALERHLKETVGGLFNLDYDLFLYDVTSTYFEREAKSNRLAQRAIPGIIRAIANRYVLGWW